jgi:hypothetical protein
MLQNICENDRACGSIEEASDGWFEGDEGAAL